MNLITEYLKDSRGIQWVTSGGFDYQIPAMSNPLFVGNTVWANFYYFTMGLELVMEDSLHLLYGMNRNVREWLVWGGIGMSGGWSGIIIEPL